MKKIFVLSLVIIVCLALVFTGCQNKTQESQGDSSATDEKVYTFKIGHGSSEETPNHKAFLKLEEIIESKTDGHIQVEIYPSQQLGGDRELTESTQFGNTAMAAPSSAPVASFAKEFYALDIPFMFPSREKAYEVLDGPAGQALLDSLDAIGLKGLGFWENGFRDLTNSKKVIKTPADLEGLKIRTMENDIHIAAWKLLGANPTPMAFGELFTSLQQKTVDGQENPLNLIYSQKLHEVQKYVSKTHHIYSPLVVFMNKDLYESLPDDYKKIVEDAVKECAGYERKLVQEMDDAAEKAMIESGVEVTELTTEELDAFRTKVEPVYDLVKEKAGEDIVNTILDAVK
ncbi:MAG: TRAP transporter substrate-binding protein [Clostridia bacterium]|nr:TRAP transporter substrate-binding protein [Clostridia bacterium]